MLYENLVRMTGSALLKKLCGLALIRMILRWTLNLCMENLFENARGWVASDI